MIFGRTAGFGQSSNAVKNLQTTLLVIRDGVRAAGGEEWDKFDPMPAGKSPDGLVHRETVQALLITALAAIEQVPGLNLLEDVPGLSHLLSIAGSVADSDLASETAWQVLKQTGKQDEVKGFVRDIAAPLDNKFVDLVARLRSGAGGGTQTMTAAERARTMTQITPVQTSFVTFTPELQTKYPAGAVAVRDPTRGVYRILVPG